MVRTLMRHALTFASLSSLALALVLGALWWWSAARTRTFEYGWRGQRWEADGTLQREPRPEPRSGGRK